MNIGRSHTCTALGWFTERAASAGVIALGVTNASPIVAPVGGSKRVIGTHPIAFAVPNGVGGVAIDQATAVVTLGVERQPSWPVATTTLAGGAERKTGMPVWRAAPPV